MSYFYSKIKMKIVKYPSELNGEICNSEREKEGADEPLSARPPVVDEGPT